MKQSKKREWHKRLDGLIESNKKRDCVCDWQKHAIRQKYEEAAV